MKPPPFEYLRPTTVQETLEILATGGEDVKILAGGQSLVPMLNLRLAHPSLLVDINALDLGGIRAAEGGLEIGTLTRQSDLISDPIVRKQIPILADAARFVGHTAIRNRGTVGGSLCHADPIAELAAVATLLSARLHLASVAGVRTLSAAEFFIGPFTTSLAPEEMLLGMTFRRQQPGERHAFVEVSERSGDFAIVAVGVRFAIQDGTIRDPAVVLAGAGSTPERSTIAEAILDGAEPGPDLFRTASAEAVAELEPQPDVRASSEFRRRLLSTILERALADALQRGSRDAA